MNKDDNNIVLAIPHDKRLYQWPNEGFLTLVQAMFCLEREDVRIIKCEEDELLSRNDYDAVFLMRTIGFDSKYIKHFKKNRILISFWHDDMHRFFCRIPRASKDLQIFEAADIFFLPALHQFRGWRSYRKFEHKAVWLPWSVPDRIFEFSQPWETRKNRILLSGFCGVTYPLRKKLFDYARHTENAYLDSLNHPGYDSNAKIRGKTGEEFYKLLGSYRGAIATTATTRLPFGFKRIDYTVAKYMEIPACGCLPLMEKTPDLSELGFVEGQHYISINRWNYRRRLNTIDSKEAPHIAKAAQELVKERHTHTHRVKVILDEIKKRLA